MCAFSPTSFITQRDPICRRNPRSGQQDVGDVERHAEPVGLSLEDQPGGLQRGSLDLGGVEEHAGVHGGTVTAASAIPAPGITAVR